MKTVIWASGSGGVTELFLTPFFGERSDGSKKFRQQNREVGLHKKQKIVKKYSRSSENEPLEIHGRRLQRDFAFSIAQWGNISLHSTERKWSFSEHVKYLYRAKKRVCRTRMGLET